MDRASGELDEEECAKENIDDFLNGELISTLRSDMKMLEKYFHAFQDLSDWSIVKEKGTMKTWCKR